MAGLAVLASAAVLLGAAGCGGEGGDELGGWLRHEDMAEGLAVLYPDDWNRAPASLTPNLTEPHEVLSLGTHGLRPGSESCSQTPGNALDDMSEQDAFITVQERTLQADAPPGTENFPARPDDFDLDPRDANVGAACSDNDGIQTWLIPFRDSGRAFYLQVAIGKSVSESTRREVAGILDSLRFVPAEEPRVTPARAQELRDGRRQRRIPSVQQ